jgi:hypothetical protein
METAGFQRGIRIKYFTGVSKQNQNFTFATHGDNLLKGQAEGRKISSWLDYLLLEFSGQDCVGATNNLVFGNENNPFQSCIFPSAGIGCLK